VSGKLKTNKAMKQ